MYKFITRENNYMKIVYIITSILFLIYLLLPNPNFPEPLDNTLQSTEPADIETPLRRSYYTDIDRATVMNIYSDEFRDNTSIIPWLNYRLNYPPEEAQTLIRDQARSTYLEEVVHPFRESLFVNGYEPKENKDIILVGDKFWKYKLTLKLQGSSVLARLVIGLLTILFIPLLFTNLKETLSDIYLIIRKIIINREF